jgi:hypothetical protein
MFDGQRSMESDVEDCLSVTVEFLDISFSNERFYHNNQSRTPTNFLLYTLINRTKFPQETANIPFSEQSAQVPLLLGGVVAKMFISETWLGECVGISM